MASILSSVKKAVGIDEHNTDFDDDLIAYINSAFITIWHVGVGKEPFSIADYTSVWEDFSENIQTLGLIKPYIYHKVRLSFDPPTGGHLDALKSLTSELEYRLFLLYENQEVAR